MRKKAQFKKFEILFSGLALMLAAIAFLVAAVAYANIILHAIVSI